MPFSEGGFADLGGRGPFEGEVSQLAGHLHQFEHALSPAEAGAGAVVAAAGFVEGLAFDVFGPQAGELEPVHVRLFVDLLALGAKHPHQPLGHDRLNRRGHQEGLHAHVDQSSDRARSVVRVERAEDQVTRKGRLDRDFGDFQVTNFTHQDDVGGLTQHRAEHALEVEADRFLDVTEDELTRRASTVRADGYSLPPWMTIPQAVPERATKLARHAVEVALEPGRACGLP